MNESQGQSHTWPLVMAPSTDERINESGPFHPNCSGLMLETRRTSNTFLQGGK